MQGNKSYVKLRFALHDNTFAENRVSVKYFVLLIFWHTN